MHQPAVLSNRYVLFAVFTAPLQPPKVCWLTLGCLLALAAPSAGCSDGDIAVEADGAAGDPGTDQGGHGGEKATGGFGSGGSPGGSDGGATPSPDALGTEIEIAQGTHPDVAVDSQGGLHVVYQSDGVWYTHASDGGGSFTAPEPVSTEGAEPKLFVDDDDDVHVVWTVGVGKGGTQGWYANKVGGAWQAPVQCMQAGDHGSNRVMVGSVVALPAKDAAIVSFSGGGTLSVLVKLEHLATGPTVVADRTLDSWPPGLVPNPSQDGFRVVARHFQGSQVSELDLAFQLTGEFFALSAETTGECGNGFRDADGLVHYTGSGAGRNEPSRVWYNNDARIAAGEPAILGAVVSHPDTSEGTSLHYWARVCPDATGRGYVAHNSDLDDGVYVSYVDGESLLTLQLAEGYDADATQAGHRVGPRCAPTDTTGVHVVYHVGTSVKHRTVGAP